MKPTNGPTRVALYLRAETLATATRQAEVLNQAVDTEPGWHIVAVFSDLTSGVDRPGRDGAMATARTGFDVLLVSSLDRLTRDTDELMELIHHLTATDVTLFDAPAAGTTQRRRDPRRRQAPGRRLPRAGRPSWRCLGPAGRAPAGR